jgi:hypothetical protein
MAIGVALIAAGLFITYSPATTLVTRTESFLEQKAPLKVASYAFEASPTSPKPAQSYVVGEDTYKILNPFGIVGRVYRDGAKAFDVLLIASNKKESFHDQRVCFAAQGYNLTDQRIETLETKRGTIPITVTQMTHKDLGEQVAILFYKGPGGFYPTPQSLAWAMFKEQLMGGTKLEAVFYRVIPVGEATTKEELLQFVRSYLEEAGRYSGGYF